jgi:hypothetical protein
VAGRSRARRTGCGVLISVLLVGAAMLVIGTRPTPSGAAPLQDADTLAAGRTAEKIAALDAAIRELRAALPDAEAALTAATATLATATAADARIQSGGLPPTPASGGGAVDTATRAILGDLAPEQTNAAIAQATSELGAATTYRDDLRTRLSGALGERVQAVGDLVANGQVKTHWAILLLDRLGAPVTTENLRALLAWIGAEANDTAFHNPLATTMEAAGARGVNEVGVKAYPSDDVGIEATAQTLHNGLYAPIIAALGAGDSALRVVSAVAASPWGTGVNAGARLQADSR